MDEEGKINEEQILKKKSNIVHIDEARVERLAVKGNYWGIFDTWNTLDIKIAYGDALSAYDARNYVLLTKYLKKYGHSEAIQIKCTKIYERYMKEQGL